MLNSLISIQAFGRFHGHTQQTMIVSAIPQRSLSSLAHPIQGHRRVLSLWTRLVQCSGVSPSSRHDTRLPARLNLALIESVSQSGTDFTLNYSIARRAMQRVRQTHFVLIAC